MQPRAETLSSPGGAGIILASVEIKKCGPGLDVLFKTTRPGSNRLRI